ncbi:HAMP domain-containing histidine kinase [Fictibacillus sp. KIGAM418]|uniref:histidine kinase n=1 Tax=Fictibacillus marinisediminis TaxID=2878389 RepID=A0A9X2BH85_9BACL|nr:HAMP domain-containing sensor histidine kinase [Fictibacillus marinisediminis]MCK6257338.1 HAMP domain-containing histidine kinase [Fictibacillus marinisediminis]
MSIRVRLLLSNLAMIIMPVILFVLAAFLLFSFVFVDHKDNRFIFGSLGTTEGARPADKQVMELKKTAALTPEKLLNVQYLIRADKELNEQGAALVVRKGDKVIYRSVKDKTLEVKDLPAFGFEGSNRPVSRLGNKLYSMQKYDFYFSNGSTGTLFFIRDADFVKRIFPLLFGSFLFIMLITNGLLTYFVSKSILYPVNELREGARKISEGNLDFLLVSKRNDELGQLCQAFETMRKKLKASTEIQLQYEENRKELISNISHDLKTPLTAIKGYVEGIRDGVANTSEKMDRYTQTIYKKANELDHLIDELFLYSKLDLKKVPFHFEKMETSGYIENYIEELRMDDTVGQVRLSLTIKEGKEFEVIADRDKLKRVFTNIIENSLKYMDKIEKSIDIVLSSNEETVLVEVHDNGPGIKESSLPHLFDRFYRADPSRNTTGSGLGLAIAKRIIEDHGGEIWAESRENEGTSIIFTLKKAVNEEASP